MHDDLKSGEWEPQPISSPSSDPAHPDFWESKYVAGDTPWDKGEAHPAVIDWIDRTGPLQGQRAVVIGCGAGHDVRALAAAGAVVIGLDIAPAAIERARQQGAGEEYRVASVFEPPADCLGAFDLVLEHTCFCAIHPRDRDRYVAGVAAMLTPGGRFVAIFFLEPGVESGPPFGVTERELADRFGPYFELGERWVPTRTFAGREGGELVWSMRRKSAGGSAKLLGGSATAGGIQ